MAKYLDDTGVGRLWARIQTLISGLLTWDNISNKPIESIGSGLWVDENSGALSTIAQDINWYGAATNTTPRYQALSKQDGGITTYSKIQRSIYFETTTKQTSSGVDVFTFTDTTMFEIDSNSCIDVFCDVYGVIPLDVSISRSGMYNVCTVSFASSDNVTKCRIYVS